MRHWPTTSARSPSAPGRATPRTPRPSIGGVDWIRAVEWVPYQLPTFVTPAFPGYVSGHSHVQPRRRRGAHRADRLASTSPVASATWTIPAGALEVEAGPTEDVAAPVGARYYDAADQAGHLAASTAASTSPRTTSAAARSAHSAAWTPGTKANTLLRRHRPGLTDQDGLTRTPRPQRARSDRSSAAAGTVASPRGSAAVPARASRHGRGVPPRGSVPRRGRDWRALVPWGRRCSRCFEADGSAAMAADLVFLLSLALRTRAPLVPLALASVALVAGRPWPSGCPAVLAAGPVAVHATPWGPGREGAAVSSARSASAGSPASASCGSRTAPCHRARSPCPYSSSSGPGWRAWRCAASARHAAMRA